MRVQLYGNVNGWRGTSRTIREMRKLVRKGKTDPTVIWTAQQLARKVDRKDYTGQAGAIFNFVRSYIHYVRDPKGVELLRSPFQTLRYRAGDCDDQAILFSALAEAIGFDSRFKTIKANLAYPDEFSHVYSQVLVPGKGWTTADTIVPKVDLGWEAKQHFGSQVWGSEMNGIGAFNLTNYHYRAVPEGALGDVGALGGRSAEQVAIMTRTAVNAALAPFWHSPLNKWIFELRQRVFETINSIRAKQKPKWIKGPPPDLAIDPAAAAVLSVEPTGQLILVIDSIFKGSSASTADSKAKFYVNAFNTELLPQLFGSIKEVVIAFARCGGMLPVPPGDPAGRKPELAPDAILNAFYEHVIRVMAGNQPIRGWMYRTFEELHKNFVGAAKTQLPEIQKILGVVYKANIAVVGDAAESAGEKVAEEAVKQGAIAPEEAAPAAEIAKKVAQGYALTPEELPLAEKMATGVRQAEVASAGKLLVPMAAAAMATKMLL